jgi:hypothetical protein
MNFVSFGYDIGEVVKDIQTADDFRIQVNDNIFNNNLSKIETVYIGGSTTSACLPYSKTNQVNLLVGVAARLGRERVVIDQALFREFAGFVDLVIGMVPEFSTPVAIPYGYEDDFDFFIKNVHYPESRRSELIELRKRLNDGEWLDKYYSINKTFQKYEHYTDFKMARGIYSRHDVFKVIVGGMFKLIEQDVFSRKEFIKKIPANLRAIYLMDNMYEPGAKYYSSDFESFESLFTPQIMRTCEMQLYKAKLRNYPNHYKLIEDTLLGDNFLKSRSFNAKVKARRMSGEMCTSLGNGFTNLMVSWFMLYKSGMPVQSLTSSLQCVIEGDDSLIKYKYPIDTTIYERIGFRAKTVFHENIGDASFCGMLFDQEDMIIITDITKQCIALGWGDRKYYSSRDSKKLSLLRAKCLSLAFQYRGCPILDKLCHRMLFLTRGYDVRNVVVDSYKRDVLEHAILNAKELIRLGPLEPGIRTRMLMEEQFGVPIGLQYYIERQIPNFTLGNNEDLVLIASPSSLTHAERHVRYIDTKLNNVEFDKLNMSTAQITQLQNCVTPSVIQSLNAAIT